jgi:hypothetical protein
MPVAPRSVDQISSVSVNARLGTPSAFEINALPPPRPGSAKVLQNYTKQLLCFLYLPPFSGTLGDPNIIGGIQEDVDAETFCLSQRFAARADEAYPWCIQINSNLNASKKMISTSWTCILISEQRVFRQSDHSPTRFRRQIEVRLLLT